VRVRADLAVSPQRRASPGGLARPAFQGGAWGGMAAGLAASGPSVGAQRRVVVVSVTVDSVVSSIPWPKAWRA